MREFRIDSGVRQGCILSPWLFNVHMDVVMKDVKIGMGRRGESGDCLDSCMQKTRFCTASQSEENLKVMVVHFVGVYKRSLEVNTDKSIVMVIIAEEGLECKIREDGSQLEQV